MAEIIKNSSIGLVKELDLFNLPPTQGTVEKIRFVNLYTSSSNPDSSPLEFVIPQSGHDFLDLSRSQLDLTARIELNGQKIAATDYVAPVNILLQSLFSQVDMFMNHVRVNSSTTNYAYRAYIPLILSMNAESKMTLLNTQLFAKDEGNLDDANCKPDGTNPGLQSRFQYVKSGQEFQLVGPLLNDVWETKRWIIPGVTIRLAMYRNSNAFVLMSTLKKDYRLVITRARLKACYCTLFDKAYLAHEAALSLTPASYPLNNTIIKNYSLPGTETEKVFNDVFSGKIPEKIIIGFVRDDAYSGNLTKNPFNFQNFDAKFVGVYYNGEPVPGRAFEPKFNAKSQYDAQYMDCYDALLRISGKYESSDISKHDYANGYTFFCFDIEQKERNTEMLTLYKTGIINLEIKLKASLGFSIQVIVFGILPYLMKINKAREVILE